MKSEFKLCYIKGNKAWFTSNFKEQWADDWNDSPYECNAGEPYEDCELKTLYFETNDWTEKQPCNRGSYSVKEINNGAVAWLTTDNYVIPAGISYDKFKKTIKAFGGKIYEESVNNE